MRVPVLEGMQHCAKSKPPVRALSPDTSATPLWACTTTCAMPTPMSPSRPSLPTSNGPAEQMKLHLSPNRRPPTRTLAMPGPQSPSHTNPFQQKQNAPPERKPTGRHACSRKTLQTMRLNTNDPLVPPKPKLFLSATSIFMSRAVLAQKSKSHSGSWLKILMVGGLFW